MSIEIAERSVREGDLAGALMALQEQVRKTPARADLRVFLFQLLSVLGEWDRALTQLNVAAELDAATLAMAQMYRETLRCERLRADVFAGRRSPMVFGEPDEWMALLVESLLVTGTPRAGEADSLRARAFEVAPPSAGSIDGKAFEWIADADMRLGPVCEAIINWEVLLGPLRPVLESRHRGALGPARCRLDAGAVPLRQRRGGGGRDPDPLSRFGSFGRVRDPPGPPDRVD